MSDGSSILLTVATLVLGAVPSWYFSRRYYLKSGTDLDAAFRLLVGDGQKTLRAVNALGHIVEQNGQGKFSRDEAGNITGIVLSATASAIGSSEAVWIPAVRREQPPQYDRQHEQPPTSEPERNHA